MKTITEIKARLYEVTREKDNAYTKARKAELQGNHKLAEKYRQEVEKYRKENRELREKLADAQNNSG